MAYLERVAEPGDGLLPGVLTFILPVFTIIILGEGVVRVLAIYLRRDEHQEEWDIWKDWHADAARSTGIRKNMETFDVTVDSSDTLKAFYDQQMPYYEKMYARRIQPEKPR